MAREKHIVNLRIENFKCFTDFEAKNLGQFNLIVGDNNTGKTSILEALFFDNEASIFDILARLDYTLWTRRDTGWEFSEDKENVYHNFFVFLNKNNDSKELQLSFDNSQKSYKISLGFFNIDTDLKYLNKLEKEKLFSSEKKLQEFILHVNGKTTTSLKAIHDVDIYYPFIPFGKGYAEDVLEFYSEKIDAAKQIRSDFISNLRCLIPNVDDVRIGNGLINIYEEGVDNPMPLFTYGEGANKLFRILCEIAMTKGKRLMIDEIDTGIHYSRFKSFWRTIMKAAKTYDVQIFATTHNQECIDYFRMVLEEEEMKSYQELARVVSLKNLENSTIKARVYNFEDLEYANETNRELRGGGI